MRLTCVSLRLRDFYPRPPRGGRPPIFALYSGVLYPISIHALREEGDIAVVSTWKVSPDFYPRPPRGGRQQKRRKHPRF